MNYIWLIWMERGAELHSRRRWIRMNKPHNIVFQSFRQTVCQLVYSFAPFQGCCGVGETDGYGRWRIWRIATPDLQEVNCLFWVWIWPAAASSWVGIRILCPYQILKPEQGTGSKQPIGSESGAKADENLRPITKRFIVLGQNKKWKDILIL